MLRGVGVVTIFSGGVVQGCMLLGLMVEESLYKIAALVFVH
jgi:hypothetical protein